MKGGKIIQPIVGEDNFRKAVFESKSPVVVDFWAEWCAPCLAIAPILEELGKEYAGKVKIARVNVDENGSLVAKYGIAAIPTLLMFKDGQPVQQVLGFKPKNELKKLINNLIKG